MARQARKSLKNQQSRFRQGPLKPQVDPGYTGVEYRGKHFLQFTCTPVPKLTNAKIETALAAPREKARKMWDEWGLYLLIPPTGEPAWRFKYYVLGREKGVSLGRLRDVPLAAARRMRDKLRQQVAEGEDPGKLRKAARLAARQTFKAVREEWEQTHGAKQAQGTKDRRASQLVYLTRLDNRPVNEITAEDVRGCLLPIQAAGKYTTAHQVRNLASQLLRYAAATGRAERDVTVELKGALTAIPKSSFAAIVDPKKLASLLKSVWSYTGQPSTMAAFRLSPLTFLRSNELRGGVWGEIEWHSEHWKAPLWNVPAQRMKMKLPHIVPLCSQAVAILRWLQPITDRGPDSLMFPGLRSPDRPISDNTLNAALKRLGYGSDEHVQHGFRSTASTLMNELHMAREDVIEIQLAHVPEGVRGIYNRAKYLPERLALMSAWGDYLDSLKGKA
jgi:integrase